VAWREKREGTLSHIKPGSGKIHVNHLICLGGKKRGATFESASLSRRKKKGSVPCIHEEFLGRKEKRAFPKSAQWEEKKGGGGSDFVSANRLGNKRHSRMLSPALESRRKLPLWMRRKEEKEGEGEGKGVTETHIYEMESASCARRKGGPLTLVAIKEGEKRMFLSGEEERTMIDQDIHFSKGVNACFFGRKERRGAEQPRLRKRRGKKVRATWVGGRRKKEKKARGNSLAEEKKSKGPGQACHVPSPLRRGNLVRQGEGNKATFRLGSNGRTQKKRTAGHGAAARATRGGLPRFLLTAEERKGNQAEVVSYHGREKKKLVILKILEGGGGGGRSIMRYHMRERDKKNLRGARRLPFITTRTGWQNPNGGKKR